MQKTPLLSENSDEAITVDDLERDAENWLLDGDVRQLSRNTLATRRFLITKLLWFLRQRGYSHCGKTELMQFLAYVRNGHQDSDGRWGNQHNRRAVRPITTASYYTMLRTLFRFLVTEQSITVSPLESMRPPVARADQIQPFSEEQVQELLAAARRSRHPRRDEAACLLLLDSGMRASELCSLQMRDLDMQERRCRVQGKGDKFRSVFFGGSTARVLWQYLREDSRQPTDPVFQSDRGREAGGALTRSGLLQLIERLGETAGIEVIRCSPHTFRHTFAVFFLRSGGNVFALKELLGHRSLTIVNRYVLLANADIENQHRQHSPSDRLKRGRVK